jgi:T-complex protein 1 subunit beta
MTTLSSKLLKSERELFKIIKKPGGCLSDSYLADGFILQKSISTGCARFKENPKIMIANT